MNTIRKVMKLPLLLTTIGSTACIANGQIASVDWGAQISNGLGTSAGVELAIGDLVRIGTFNLSDTQIRDAQSNLSLLNQAFVEYDSSAIGADLGVPGHWNSLGIKSTDSLGLNGKRIYVWAFDAPSMQAAHEQGIFSSSKLNWVFPSDQAIPNTTTIDISEVQTEGLLIGGFGQGVSSATGAVLFNLAPVPEPANSAFVFGIAVMITSALVRVWRESPNIRR